MVSYETIRHWVNHFVTPRRTLGGLALQIEAQFAHLGEAIQIHDGDADRFVVDLDHRLVRRQAGQCLPHRPPSRPRYRAA